MVEVGLAPDYMQWVLLYECLSPWIPVALLVPVRLLQWKRWELPTCMLEKHSHEKGPFARMTSTQGSICRWLPAVFLESMSHSPFVTVDTYLFLELGTGWGLVEVPTQI